MKIGINSGYIYISASVGAFVAIEVCSVRFLKEKISGGGTDFFGFFGNKGKKSFRIGKFFVKDYADILIFCYINCFFGIIEFIKEVPAVINYIFGKKNGFFNVLCENEKIVGFVVCMYYSFLFM